jgi:Tfp pilus assembly protein PilN
MPSINMIAPRRALKKRFERDVRKLVIVLLAELFVAVLLGGGLCTKLLTTKLQISNLDRQLSKLEPVVTEIDKYDTATSELLPKLGLLYEAKSSTMRWYNILDSMTRSIPQPAYINSLNSGNEIINLIMNGADKNSGKNIANLSTTLNIIGIATSQAQVGETMLRLNKIPEFKTVELKSAKNCGPGLIQGVNFEIKATLNEAAKSQEVPSASNKS